LSANHPVNSPTKSIGINLKKINNPTLAGFSITFVNNQAIIAKSKNLIVYIKKLEAQKLT
jgi:hypothetical protein